MKNEIELYLGNDGDNKIYKNLSEVGNILACGTVGSGKTIYVRTLLKELMNNLNSKEIRFVLCDPKHTSFENLKESPYVYNNKIIHKTNEFKNVIDDLLAMSQERAKSRNDDQTLLLVVDEIADYELDEFYIEKLVEIFKNSEKSGIYALVTTQRTDIINNKIINSVNTVLAFETRNKNESVRILGTDLAANLKGQGDVLIKNEKLFKNEIQHFQIVK